MKISIAQNEIELAITNYIRSMVALAAGTDITIDFSATRGPEGLTANINITQAAKPPVEEQPKAEQVDEVVPAQTTTAKQVSEPTKTKRLVVTDPKATKEADKPVVQQVEEKVPETSSAASSEEVATTTSEEAPVTTEAQAGGFPGFAKEKTEVDPEPPFTEEKEVVAETTTTQEPVKEEQPVRKSLFGGLARPSNS